MSPSRNFEVEPNDDSQQDRDSVSSHASEFVDATQQHTDNESQNSSQSFPTPVRIKRDMQFLKESWET